MVDGDFTNSLLSQNIKPEDTVVPGQTYTTLQLAEKMIEDSDNASMILLLKNIDQKYRNGVFKSVGVPFMETEDDILIRVKDYAGFFSSSF